MVIGHSKTTILTPPTNRPIDMYTDIVLVYSTVEKGVTLEPRLVQVLENHLPKNTRYGEHEPCPADGC
jgi:hypothetical protein